MNAAIVLVSLCLVASEPTGGLGSISGVVVNGSHREEAMANTEVVLRLIENGTSLLVSQTTSDQRGRFTFDNLPLDQSFVYLPGANLDGVHYPGPRVRLTDELKSSNVKLVVFETVDEPSPLVAKKHDLMIQASIGVLEITETMLIENPTRSTYVGKKTRDTAPVTLRLSLPADFESVTFHDEFHGRSFFVLDGKLMTDIPWPPGHRQITFTYRIPIEQRGRLLARSLDLPCSDITVRVKSDEIENVSCNLPTANQTQKEICFEQAEQILPVGHQVRIQLGKLPIPLMGYARWIAVGALVVLIIGTVMSLAWRHRQSSRTTAKQARPTESVRRRAA
jgi:hypothetical protein